MARKKITRGERSWRSGLALCGCNCFHTSSRRGPEHAEEGTGSSGEHPPGELFRNGPSPGRDEPPGTSPSGVVFSLISSTLLVKLTPGSKRRMESPHRAKLCSTFPVFSFQSVLITQIMCLNRSCPLYN